MEGADDEGRGQVIHQDTEGHVAWGLVQRTTGNDPPQVAVGYGHGGEGYSDVGKGQLAG